MDKHKRSDGQWNFHPEWKAAYLIDAPAGTSEKKIMEVLLRLHPGCTDNLEHMVHQAIHEARPYSFGSHKELVLNCEEDRWCYGATWMIENDERPKDWIIPISRYMLSNKLDLI